MKKHLPPMRNQAGYDPNRLLNALMHKLNLRNDKALSRVLSVSHPIIGQIRRHTLPIGAWLLMRMQEVSEIGIEELRMLMGDRRQKIRLAIPARNLVGYLPRRNAVPVP